MKPHDPTPAPELAAFQSNAVQNKNKNEENTDVMAHGWTLNHIEGHCLHSGSTFLAVQLDN